MKITRELTLVDFKAWSGAINTKDMIIEHHMENEFEQLIEDCYPEGIDQTKLNDILWFEADWIFESLGINQEEE